jgi:hypothetical protein
MGSRFRRKDEGSECAVKSAEGLSPSALYLVDGLFAPAISSPFPGELPFSTPLSKKFA